MEESNRVITPAEAIAAYERAFRLGNPSEVEKLLRNILNVQVAVVESLEKAKEVLREGKKLATVPVPYDVFLGKSQSLKESYHLDLKAVKEGDWAKALHKVTYRDEILPNCTYVLLKHEAGYSREFGLTFEGEGEITGFEDQPAPECREKFMEGKFQTFKEHVLGAWERSGQIIEFYKPFIKTWAENVLTEHSQEQREKFVENVTWSLRIVVLLHDIGKLNRNWQAVVWRNEERIRGRTIPLSKRNEPIARTSAVSDPAVRERLERPPPHAPFAYPFLRTFLRTLSGDYRFWDVLALATARHHSLEVSGAVAKGAFQLSDTGTKVLEDLLTEVLSPLSDEEEEVLKHALYEALKSVQEGSEMDEPPSPSDDLYFLYCLANRLVKVCDWEDAGGETIELPELRGKKDAVAG